METPGWFAEAPAELETVAVSPELEWACKSFAHLLGTAATSLVPEAEKEKV